MTSQNTTQRVLLVGCGQLGTELGTMLSADGWDVVGLRRHAQLLPPQFSQVSRDLTAPVPEPLPAVDAMVITLTPSIQDSTGDNGYLTALRHLHAALPSVPSRVIFVSSTRVFEGADTHRELTEADPVAPTSERGHLLVAAEQLANELFGAHIVRPAGIYGPGREMLLRKVRQNEPVQYARRTNRIHQTDLARGLQKLLTAETAPAVLHAIDHTPGVPLGDVVTYIATRLNVAAPPAIEPADASGRVLSGARLHELLGTLSYPTYQHGYDHLIAASQTTP